MLKRRVALGFTAAAVTVSLVLASSAAYGVSLFIDPSATLASGQGRYFSAAWGSSAPYKVTFKCHLAGCADFVTSSTTTTTLTRHVQVTTCTGLSATSTIAVVEAGGGSASTSTTTTWLRGSVC